MRHRISSLVGDDEKTHRLADYRGRRVVLYFYPRDNTPANAGGVRLPRSPADARRCGGARREPRLGGIAKKFKQKYELPFTLLPTPAPRWRSATAPLGEDSVREKSLGIIRSTFVIDEKGRLSAGVWEGRGQGHVEKVREVVWADPRRPPLKRGRGRA